MVIAFHKPFGVLSQFTPENPGDRTLAEFGFPPDVYPLGRLDKDSEGLLLLSGQKGLNARLLHPSAAHPRQYWAQVERIPSDEALEILRAGVKIKTHHTLPCHVSRITGDPLPARVPPIRERKSVPTAWLALTLIEGKNRQVRRMTAAIGHPTLRLFRSRIGDFEIGSLSIGTHRPLTSSEERALFVKH